MTDVAYGNARVRARKADLLGPRDWSALLRSGDLDGLVAELAGRAGWRVDVEAALTRYEGARRLDEAIRRHRARVWGAVVGWYAGDRRGRDLGLLAARLDVENVRVLVRGLARLEGPETLLGLLVPAGALDEAALRALAGAAGLREAVDRLVEWGLPTPDLARALLRAFPAYEAARGDVRVLERALDGAWAERLRGIPRGAVDPHVEAVLRGAVDRRNLDATLRLRRARRRGEATDVFGEPFLEGGRLPVSRFVEALDASDRAEVVRRLRAGATHPAWRAPLRDWVGDGDPVALADALDAGETREAVAAFWRGDPLSLAIPIAYLAATEHEAANLRRLGRGLADGVPPDRLELEVTTPW